MFTGPYICHNCGEIFDEPRVYRESHGFTDGFYETQSWCPYCGGDFEDYDPEAEDEDEEVDDEE